MSLLFVYNKDNKRTIFMARTPTTSDPFSAIAEPKRRELIEAMVGKELTVSELVDITGWNQPMVSKHLNVLKQVELVSERKDGRFRVYTINAEPLKPIQDWVIQFEHLWTNRMENLEGYLEKLQSIEVDDNE